MLSTPTTLSVQSVADVQEAVRSQPRVLPRGGGSKTALSTPPTNATLLDLSGLSGILEYEPDEYTITARAGTPLADVAAALAEHGQYLPFDPPLIAAGATVGGTVAAGLSGSGRYRYGGVRDFLIGVRFVDGRGELVRGGGKVVKNAAGFDLPKLMVGSLGRLGILTEASFKVFPQPRAYISLRCDHASLAAAIATLHKLSASAFDIEAVDPVPSAANADVALWIRLGGLEAVLPERAERVQTFLSCGEILSGEAEADHWRGAREFAWLPADAALVKVPTTTRTLPALDERLARVGAARRYAVAGNLTWIGWPHEVSELDALLTELELAGLILIGSHSSLRIGVQTGQVFAQRIQRALDPEGRFLKL